MNILIALLIRDANAGEKSIFAGQTFPWMQPEMKQDHTLKKCLSGGTCRVGRVALLAANLWFGLHDFESICRFIKDCRVLFTGVFIGQKLHTTLSWRMQLYVFELYCG
jgi:hypothetical protein